MTNDQIIKLASEANSLTQALDEGGDNPELARRLDWIFNLVSKDDAPRLILAMKILQGKLTVSRPPTNLQSSASSRLPPILGPIA